jgi:hypothetical protein
MNSNAIRDIRNCQCGCGLTFVTSPQSHKIYFNRRHAEAAKKSRRVGQPLKSGITALGTAEVDTRNLDDIFQLMPPSFSPEVVLSLIATTSNKQHPSGTAVMISPHCGITAKHVVDEYFQFTKSPDTELSILGRSGLVTKHQNRDWRFKHVVTNPGSDIAVLVLESDQAPIYGLHYPNINVIPPEVGDIIIAVGFHSSRIEASMDEVGPVSKWIDRPMISKGRVFEVHQQRRDQTLMPYPSFTADCRVRGGMSGGPVLDESGFLRGIVSRGFSSIDATTAQSIWTSLILPIDKTPLPQYGYGSSLYEAALRGKIVAFGIGRLEALFNTDGSIETLSLKEPPA